MPKRKKTTKAPKAAFSFKKHILPPLIGLAVMLFAFGLLNAQWIVAQGLYRFDKPNAANLVIPAPSKSNPSAIDPALPPKIFIPKFDAKAPIIFEPSYNEYKVQLALRGGVVHYGSTANPGQKGNVVIFGHSSGQLWTPGNYKFVFTLLNKLQANDQIIVDYKGTQYIYKVTTTEVVAPTNLSVLDQGSQPTLALVTCSPVGTNKNRLVVHAQQISPQPSTAVATSGYQAPIAAPSHLPGNASSSFWHALFGWL